MITHTTTDTFDQHGLQFWERQGPYRTLHDINPTRLNFIKQYINLHNAHLLDIGCGGGILAESLCQAGAHVTGIDLSHSVLTAAREHAQTQDLEINYRQCSSHTCVAANEEYDHITCMEMLEHVKDPSAILRDIATLLKPGGYAFLSTINRTRKSWLGAIAFAEYITQLVPRGTHKHDWFITPAELTNMSEHAGLDAITLCGLHYNPLTHRAKLSRSLEMNYFLVVQKPQYKPA